MDMIIGKHINSRIAKSQDWYSIWPAVNNDGIILSIYDGDAIPDDAILVDWSTRGRGGHPIIVNGDNGFEAILV